MIIIICYYRNLPTILYPKIIFLDFKAETVWAFKT